MMSASRYPQFNDRPHTRPILSVAGKTPLAELVWLLIPVAIILLAVLLR